MNNLTAVIPVRAGSQRVKDKNLKPFADSNLLEVKINQIKKLPVDRIIVNTDSPQAIQIAKQHGVEFFERDAYYASSKCSNSEYHEYLARVTEAENLLIAQVTSPLIKKQSYLNAIQKFFESDNDSIMSTQRFQNFLLKDGKPVNYELHNMCNSQDLEPYHVPTFGIVICKRDEMLKYKNYICGKCGFIELTDTESVDIDTPLDFKVAEFLYKTEGMSFD
jgi:CMP-N-acetylneuraminic acid synthetase